MLGFPEGLEDRDSRICFVFRSWTFHVDKLTVGLRHGLERVAYVDRHPLGVTEKVEQDQLGGAL